MSFPRSLTKPLARGLAVGGVIAFLRPSPALGAGAAAGAATVSTNRGCYTVGQSVSLTGAGFAPYRTFDVAIQGVDSGHSTTDSSGRFSVALIPGGLSAGQPQHVERLHVSDGTSSADIAFTLTRMAGGRVLAARGSPHTLRARFEVWGFALDGSVRPVYLHYVSPSGGARMTLLLGHTGGQCGYMRTPRLRVFPFSPSLGAWTLQLDTSRAYWSRPRGPVARVRVVVGRG